MKFTQRIKSIRKAALLGAVTSLLIIGGVVFGGVQRASADLTLSSGTDCDNNAVVYCGALKLSTLQSKYAHGDAHNSTASIQNIFKWFGISSSDVSSMGNYAVDGYVTKTGNVYAGGELVATNALTAGRSNIAGSTLKSQNGTQFYTRPPSVSFVSSSINAYVVMVNGKFAYAVLGSCGNPVIATPKTPSYSITKQVRVKGQSAWTSNVAVTSGTHVQYQVVVKSTGAVSAHNVNVRDVLPANTTYVSGTLARNGSAFSGASAFFGAGTIEAKITPAASVVYTFEAVIGKNDTVETCTSQTLVNSGMISSPGLPNLSGQATVNKNCAPKPVYSCDLLTATQLNRTDFSFTTKATAQNGTTIAGYVYNFGDGNTQTVTSTTSPNTVNHSYQADKTYNVSVAVLISVGGTTKQVSSQNCTTNITVKPASVTACVNLSASPTADLNRFTLKATASADNGATIQGYDFSVKNSSGSVVASPSVNTTANTASTDVTAQQDGTYNSTVSVRTSEGTKTAPACNTTFTVTPNPQPGVTITKQVDGVKYEQVAVGQQFTYQVTVTNTGAVDLKNAVVTDTPPAGVVLLSADKGSINANQWTYTIPSLKVGESTEFMLTAQVPNYVAGSLVNTACVNAPEVNPESPDKNDSCDTANVTVTPPETPQVLPDTGAGSVVGLFAAVVIGSALGYRFLLSRKLS